MIGWRTLLRTDLSNEKILGKLLSLNLERAKRQG